METLYLFIILLCIATTNSLNYKEQFCMELSCDEKGKKTVCGMRKEEKGVKLRIFDNQCLLMKYGCTVEDGDEYGLADLILCKRAFPHYFKEKNVKENPTSTEYYEISKNDRDIIDESCDEYCTDLTDTKNACGISKYGTRFKVRLFLTRCEMLKYNCVRNATFVQTELHICDGLDVAVVDEPVENTLTEATGGLEASKEVIDANNNGKLEEDTNNVDTNIDINKETDKSGDFEQVTEAMNNNRRRKATNKRYENIVIVDRDLLNYNGDINSTIENFFNTTHHFELPFTLVHDLSNETITDEINNTRRKHLRIIRPAKVFHPLIEVPKNLKSIPTDRWHEPTLSSCYHKCPTRCPDTYAPVCGNPGGAAREPSLTFLNHCFMDVAQCKMRWEERGNTYMSSAYQETSFVFCLGDVMSDYLRFLPLLRTLQHMGRLKKKGLYKYKIRNWGQYNNYLLREPKMMG